MRILKAVLMTALMALAIPVSAQTVNVNPFSGTLNGWAMRTDANSTTTSSSTPDLSSLYNVPYGIPRLNGNAAIISPVVGIIDNATVGGQNLGNVITGLQQENAASKWIPLTSYDVAKGTPQLDGNAQLHNQGLNLYHHYVQSDNTVIDVPIAYMGTTNLQAQYYTLQPDTQVFGGVVASTTKADGTSVSYPAYSAMTIIGRPSGPFNAGCVTCIFATDGSLSTTGAAGISAQDYRTGQVAVSAITADATTTYQYDENYAARAVSPVTSFTSTTATLTTPLTEAQMAQIHQGMYVATNVISPTMSATTSTGLIAENTYWGIVKSVSATQLTVYGWAVLNGGDTSAGQVPNANYLDTTKSAYSGPVVFIGVPGRTIGHKNDIVFDGTKTYGGSATSRSNVYERDLTTFTAKQYAKEDSLLYHGFTTNFTCLSCDANAVNKDSYGEYLNTPGLPYGYKVHLYSTGVEFAGDGGYFTSNGAPASALLSNHIMYDFASALPTGLTKHLGARVYHDIDGDLDSDNYAIRLGVTEGGTRSQDTFVGGVDRGFISFGARGVPGNVCLETASQEPSLCSDASGNITIANGLTVGSLTATSYHVGSATITPTTGSVTGSGYITQYNDYGNSEVDNYAIRANTSASSGYVWGVLSAGSTTKMALILSQLSTSGASYTVPVSQTSVSSTTGGATYSSGGYTTMISGRTGGSAVGNYSVGLNAVETPGKWTGAVLSLNGYTGSKSWRFSDDGSIVFPDGTAFNGHLPDFSAASYVGVSNAQTVTGAKVFCTLSNCTDLQPTAARDIKVEGGGIAITGGTYTDNLWAQGAAGVTGLTLNAIDQNNHSFLEWNDQYHQETGNGYYVMNGTNIQYTASQNARSFLTYTPADSPTNGFLFQVTDGKTIKTPFTIQRDSIAINAKLVFTDSTNGFQVQTIKTDTLSPMTAQAITATAPIILPSYTRAKLPGTYPTWGEVVCTDCRSYLTASRFGKPGIKVMFNGNTWQDSLGNALPAN